MKMRVIFRTFTSYSRRLVFTNSNVTLTSRYFNKVASQLKRENLQLEYLKSVIDKNQCDWKEVKTNILSKEGNMSEKNIDAIMIKFLIGEEKWDSAHSFTNYLLQSGIELNLGVTNCILLFYTEYSKINPLPEEARKFILASYKHLYDKYKLLDYLTCERLLKALCAINEWRMSLKVLDDIHLSSTPSHSTYSTLISTLFKNSNKSEALKIVQRSLNDRRPLQYYAYDEWINYIFRKYKDKRMRVKNLDELYHHLSQNYIKVPEQTAEKIRKTLVGLDWSVDYATIKRDSGKCSCCNHRLDNVELSDEEFSLLQQNVKEKLIVGSDLFLKTSPTELQRFLKFIDSTGPYDVVLDGLNIAYAIGLSTIGEKTKALSMVVDYFWKKNKKILLLGRKHMYKWNSPTFKDLSQKTCGFFTDDVSQDDPFFITAAILSGANTDIVSRDLLRGHKFLMKQDKLRLIFQRWQWRHQWSILTSKKKPILRAPLTFSPFAQKHDLGWHIPYEKAVETEENYLNVGDPDCTAWLCIRENVNK